jgi:hypothetical protein
VTVDREQIRRDAETWLRTSTGGKADADPLARHCLALLDEQKHVPALVEALRAIIALPVPRAVEAIAIADDALAAFEAEQ